MMTEDTEMDDAFLETSGGDEEMMEETTEETPESIDEVEAKNPTALLPTSALGEGVREGDTVTVKVVKLHGDEVEVEISSSSKPTKEAMSSDEELDSMEKENY